MKKGYTLIEMLIVVSLMAIILLGGTTIFFRNLRSGGVGNIDMNVNSELRSVLSMIEKDIRFSNVISVGSGTRSDCVIAGADGYMGNSLTVADLQGLTTTYLLDTEKIASFSAVTAKQVDLTSPAAKVTGLRFTWYCLSGISDKMKIEIDMKSAVVGSGFDITRTVSREINLLNSGIN